MRDVVGAMRPQGRRNHLPPARSALWRTWAGRLSLGEFLLAEIEETAPGNSIRKDIEAGKPREYLTKGI